MPINLKAQTAIGLRNSLENSGRLRSAEMEQFVVREPKFTLYLGNGSRREAEPYKVYIFDQLTQALADWEAMARSASDGVA